MYRPYWNSYHSFGSASRSQVANRHRGKVLMLAGLLTAYVGVVVAALWALG